jgi:ribonuclease III
MEPPEPLACLSPTPQKAVEALCARLGLALSNPELALAALTHKSFVNEHRGDGLQDNERLEFLGDAVIDLAVSHRLMERFPGAREGELSKIRAALVDEAGLSRIARDLDLGPLLRLGRGEELTGGREKSSLLADALEAVVAALYLGGGLGPVLSLIDRFLGEAFERAAAGTLDRDYKTQLQELAQSRLRASPRYRVVAEHGPDHSKVFEVELELRGEVAGRGAGRSKKDAEQAAAKLALDWIGERASEVRAPPASPSLPELAAAGQILASVEEAVLAPAPVPVVELAEETPPEPKSVPRKRAPRSSAARKPRAPRTARKGSAAARPARKRGPRPAGDS